LVRRRPDAAGASNPEARIHEHPPQGRGHDLEAFGEGATIDIEFLAQKGLVGGKAKVKLLGEGDAPQKLTIKVHRISASAKEKVEAAGGSVEILS